jgi:hypothetical protein
MKTTWVPIGHARGVCIPKPLIEPCGLTEQGEMDVQDGVILLHAPRQPRAGWGTAFARMVRAGDDKRLDGQPISTRWDEEGWQWK